MRVSFRSVSFRFVFEARVGDLVGEKNVSILAFRRLCASTRPSEIRGGRRGRKKENRTSHVLSGQNVGTASHGENGKSIKERRRNVLGVSPRALSRRAQYGVSDGVNGSNYAKQENRARGCCIPARDETTGGGDKNRNRVAELIN